MKKELLKLEEINFDLIYNLDRNNENQLNQILPDNYHADDVISAGEFTNFTDIFYLK